MTAADATGLLQLRDALRQFADERDWDQYHSPKNLASALAVEAAELLERFQWLTEDQSRSLPPAELAKVREEMADVLNYLVRLADKLDVNLLEALTELIHLRLTFRAEQARNSIHVGEDSSSSRFTQLYPSGELLISYPLLQLQALYDLVHTSFGGVDAADRQLERQLARASWQPEFLPDVTIEAERRAVSDASQALSPTI